MLRGRSAVEDREVEVLQGFEGGEYVDVDDRAVTECDVPGDPRTSAHRPHDPDRSVDERGLCGERTVISLTIQIGST